MRVIHFLILLLLVTACSSETKTEIEHDVFIASLKRDFDSTGHLILTDTSKAVHFSKDFWNYFIKTHPKSSNIVFVSPLYDTNNNYLMMGDTSFTFYNPTIIHSHFFSKLLADNVNEKEKESEFGSAVFVIPKDTTGYTEHQKKISQRLSDYTITPLVTKEFHRFKDILTLKDSSHHYIIIFKKNFADKIFKLYQ